MRWLTLPFALGLLAALLASTTSSPALALGARVLLLASVLPALASLGQPTGPAERSWLALLALLAFGHAAAAALASASGMLPLRPRGTIGEDLQRQLFLCALAGLLALQFRWAGVRRVALGALGLVALAASAQIFYAYAVFGEPLALLDRGAEFKVFAADRLDIKVNPLSFTAVLAATLAFPWWGRSRLRWVIAAISGAAVIVSGSRSTQATLIAGALFLAVLRGLGRMGRRARWTAALAATTAGLCLGVVAPEASSLLRLDPQELSRVTTGRLDLWMSATARFAERPLEGWGAQSARWSSVTFLPQSGWSAEEVRNGGYHSMYLGILADKGLLAAVPSLLLLLALYRWTLRIRRGADLLDAPERAFARLAPAVLIMLATRGVSENAGIIGEANGPVDFMAYAFAAAVVALLADLETVSPEALHSTWSGDADARRTGTSA